MDEKAFFSLIIIMKEEEKFEKDDRFLAAILWLWRHNDMNSAFGHSVVTENNRKLDTSTINPPLNVAEAINLFEFLERKELLYKIENSWLINKIERNKWIDLIGDLKKPDFVWSWWFRVLSTSSLFILSSLAGALIGVLVSSFVPSKEIQHPVTINLGKSNNEKEGENPSNTNDSSDNIAPNSSMYEVIDEPPPKATETSNQTVETIRDHAPRFR